MAVVFKITFSHVVTLFNLVIRFLLFYPEDDRKTFLRNVGACPLKRKRSHTRGLLARVISLVYNQNMTYTHCVDHPLPPQYVIQNVPPVFVPVSHFALLPWCHDDELHFPQHFPILLPEHIQPNDRLVFAKPLECGTLLLVAVSVHAGEGDGHFAPRPTGQEVLNQTTAFDAWGV
jgi:hypothetical protein